LTSDELKNAENLTLADNLNELTFCNIYIITVPTPIDKFNNPDTTFLKQASMAIGKILKKNDIVVYESTVYPGLTREVCVPILETASNLKLDIDFGVGYSPERINPGDQERKLKDITKIISASNKSTLDQLKEIYGSIIEAGIFEAETIEVAEAAKVIENIQRDVNIALMNELSKIFTKLNIPIYQVLEAANTKWNFIPFTPGLVGGHCIGVDPYYLLHKATEVSEYPEIISAARRINNDMTDYAVTKLLKNVVKERLNISTLSLHVYGLTFKENCPDLRNSKIIEFSETLLGLGIGVSVYDPYCDERELPKELRKIFVNTPDFRSDVFIIGQPHNQILLYKDDLIEEYSQQGRVLMDFKGTLRNSFQSCKNYFTL
jgi:UDP-N-acetyl-D-glucosamine/UDP-N-acetyl-D-galactosamine dehydrogenase